MGLRTRRALNSPSGCHKFPGVLRQLKREKGATAPWGGRKSCCSCRLYFNQVHLITAAVRGIGKEGEERRVLVSILLLT